jgi:hypothetical protein
MPSRSTPHAKGLHKLCCAHSFSGFGAIGARRAGRSFTFARLAYIAKEAASVLSTLHVKNGNPPVSAESIVLPLSDE